MANRPTDQDTRVINIGLIDVDSHNFPNLALMKLSAWHKAHGDQVEWWNGLKHYNKVYMSKVFDDTYSKDMNYCINADEVVKGGTGYDLANKLADEIEHIYPDYNLYGELNTAYGFLTRGCPRNCEFCIVSEKEGRKSHKVADITEFWNGQKNIVLLDPNITASKDCDDLFLDLVKTKSYIDFNQGIDIRFMTDEKAELLNQMRIKTIHFAWDNYEFATYDRLKNFRTKLRFNGRSLRVYVLTNFNTTIEQDLERIYKLRELDYDPYVMVYDKPHSSRTTKQIQRWVNSKFIWRSVERFEDYKGGTHGISQ